MDLVPHHYNKWFCSTFLTACCSDVAGLSNDEIHSDIVLIDQGAFKHGEIIKKDFR